MGLLVRTVVLGSLAAATGACGRVGFSSARNRGPDASATDASPTDAATSDTSALGPKRIFLTSTVYDGNLGGLAGADAKCQARADAAHLGGTWKAILSTRTIDAVDRIDASVARVNVDGTLVMNANQMFGPTATDGYPLVNPILDEFGQPVTGNVFPFAGGGPDGRHAEPDAPHGLGWDDACMDWTSTTGQTTCGYNNSTSEYWLSGCGGISCAGYVSGVGIHCAED